MKKIFKFPFKNGTLAFGLSVFVHFLFSSCSVKEVSHKKNSSSTTVLPFEITYTPQTLNLNEPSEVALVSSATNINVSVSSCASGYTKSSTAISSNTVNLYKGDRNCLVKLTSFTFDSITYSPTGGTDFTTWLANDTANFKNVAGSETIKVFVISQATQSGVQTSDTIIYKFTDISQNSSSNFSSADVSNPASISVVGQAAPNYALVEARLLSTNANGSANISLTLQCNNTLTGSSNATYACDSILLNSQLDYILISDNYLQGTITTAQANTAFNTYTPTSVNSLIVAPGGNDLNSNTLPRGGFYTSNASPLVTGTTPFYPYDVSNVFILRERDTNGNTISYLYFYIQFGTITGVYGCNNTIFAGGSGTVGSPYQISDATTLQNTQYCTSSSNYFTLTSDIDLRGSPVTWTPINLYGQLDGANHTISNLYVNGVTTDYGTGLFSIIKSGASVNNLTISNANITGYQYEGVLAGFMEGGTVNNVTVSGSVTSNSSSFFGPAGGLLGRFENGTVSNVISSASVTFNPSTSSPIKVIGGLIGQMQNSSTGTSSLSNCKSSGAVTATAGNYSTFLYIGGLAGQVSNHGTSTVTVTNCYATGNVTVNALTDSASNGYNFTEGGLIGAMQDGNITISKSFATGSISGTGTTTIYPIIGGFVGQIYATPNTVQFNDNYTMGNITQIKVGTGGNEATVGGFAGSVSTTPSLSRNYSVANSISTQSAASSKGFVGFVSGAATFSNNYFYDGPSVPSDTQTGVTALTTTTAIQTQGSYTGFDFSTPVWKMPSVNPLSPNAYLSPVHYWICGTNGIVCP